MSDGWINLQERSSCLEGFSGLIFLVYNVGSCFLHIGLIFLAGVPKASSLVLCVSIR